MNSFSPGDVIVVDFGSGTGHEQIDQHPAIVVSEPRVGGNSLGLIIVVPLTKTERNWWSVVKVEKGDGEVRQSCFAECHQIRAISKNRVLDRWGSVKPSTLRRIRTVLSSMI